MMNNALLMALRRRVAAPMAKAVAPNGLLAQPMRPMMGGDRFADAERGSFGGFPQGGAMPQPDFRDVPMMRRRLPRWY